MDNSNRNVANAIKILSWAVLFLGAIGSFQMGAAYSSRYETLNMAVLIPCLVSTIIIGLPMWGFSVLIEEVIRIRENITKTGNTAVTSASDNKPLTQEEEIDYLKKEIEKREF